MVGLAISYALGITGKLSGLVTSFTGSFHTERNQGWMQILVSTETERELVAVERVQQYVNRIQPEQVGSWKQEQVGTIVSGFSNPQ